MKHAYQAEIIHLNNAVGKIRLEELLQDNSVEKFDHIYEQLAELMKIENPSKNFSDEELSSCIATYLNGTVLENYGLWVYFPWSRRCVHILNEEEFVAVRTNRNKLKITAEEQSKLKEKTIGVIGLSVGQSIALTIAMERICGCIKLADFDTAELSNLNRIRTGIHNLGINKTIIAAREIAEIDPFIRVEIFPEGLSKENMIEFFQGNHKLDLLIEVCDGLDIKLASRVLAKQYGIPVVMETNDRCMLDVERFDLERDRPILHGLVNENEISGIGQLTAEERLALVLRMVDGENLSERMKASFGAIGKSIRSWPQLASSVTMGGAVTTDVSRKILLQESVKSGRCYFDIDHILLEESIYN